MFCSQPAASFIGGLTYPVEIPLTNTPIMTKIYHNYILSISLFVLILFVAGCGGGSGLKTYRVEGTVTLNGQPVADASLTFYPVSGEHSGYAKTDASGKYKLSTNAGDAEAGIVPGEYTVTISKSESVPTGKTYATEDENGKPITAPEMTLKETLPAQYTKVQSTPLKAVVEAKKLNEINFPLE